MDFCIEIFYMITKAGTETLQDSISGQPTLEKVDCRTDIKNKIRVTIKDDNVQRGQEVEYVKMDSSGSKESQARTLCTDQFQATLLLTRFPYS